MYRHELKYMLNPADAAVIKSRLKSVCRFDVNTDENGRYKVSSLYFDDYCNSAINDNLTGGLRRKKFRIRVYNNGDSLIKLEKKSKHNEGGFKESVNISREQYEQILRGEVLESNCSENDVLNDFINFQKTRLLKPRVVVEYDREAYVFEPGDVRITFDSNVRSSVNDMDILDRSIITAPVIKDCDTIMEVKYTGFIPGFIKNVLTTGNGNRQAFSKYVACRTYIS